MRVLVEEDEERLATILAKGLAEHGYRADGYPNEPFACRWLTVVSLPIFRAML